MEAHGQVQDPNALSFQEKHGGERRAGLTGCEA
jgi:hypothetical protein